MVVFFPTVAKSILTWDFQRFIAPVVHASGATALGSVNIFTIAT
jgi:hypothetical protein